MTNQSALEAHCNAHIILLVIITAARGLHTTLYTLGIFRLRSLSWFTGVLSVLGMANNMIIVSFETVATV